MSARGSYRMLILTMLLKPLRQCQRAGSESGRNLLTLVKKREDVFGVRFCVS